MLEQRLPLGVFLPECLKLFRRSPRVRMQFHGMLAVDLRGFVLGPCRAKVYQSYRGWHSVTCPGVRPERSLAAFLMPVCRSGMCVPFHRRDAWW